MVPCRRDRHRPRSRPDRRPPAGGRLARTKGGRGIGLAPDPDPLARARRQIHAQSASIALALAPFGIAFGVTAADAGLGVAVTVGFSALVFAGSAQFAAVGVLAAGGSAAAAVAAGLLLNLRSLAFGVAMAPALQGPWWWRAAVSHLMIDESTAVGTARVRPRMRRYGYLVAGLAVFVVWNLSTLAGIVLLSSAGGIVETWGLDATIPAAFLALLWPRLDEPTHRLVAAGGALVALATVPVAPPGVPILLAGAAAVLGRPWRGPDGDRGAGT